MRKWAAILGLMMCFSVLHPAAAQETDDAQYELLYATQGSSDADYYTYQVQVVNAASGKNSLIEKLNGRGSDAGWSPRGNFIYLVNGNEGTERSLTLVKMTDGGRQPVTDQFPPNICGTPLLWSPDDRYLAYMTGDTNQTKVYIFDTRDNSIQTLGNSEGGLYPAAWSFDGRYFAYLPNESPSKTLTTVWDANEKKLVAQPETETVYWSPTDERIAYMDGDSKINVLNVADGSQQSYSGSTIVGWSADGRYLTFYMVQQDQPPQINRVDTSGKDAPLVREINASGFGNDASLWSSDGRYFVYRAADADQSFAAVLDMTTGNSTKLVGGDLSDTYGVQWSPGTHWLAMPQLPNGNNDTIAGFWVFDIDAHKQQELAVTTPNIVYDNPLRWSPDGTYLMDWTENGVVLFNRPHGTVHKIDNIAGGISLPRWSSDSHYLAFMGEYDLNTDIDILDAARFEMRNFTNSPTNYDLLIGWRGSGDNHSLINCGEG